MAIAEKFRAVSRKKFTKVCDWPFQSGKIAWVRWVITILEEIFLNREDVTVILE